jgi:hypothetical protein
VVKKKPALNWTISRCVLWRFPYTAQQGSAHTCRACHSHCQGLGYWFTSCAPRQLTPSSLFWGNKLFIHLVGIPGWWIGLSEGFYLHMHEGPKSDLNTGSNCLTAPFQSATENCFTFLKYIHVSLRVRCASGPHTHLHLHHTGVCFGFTIQCVLIQRGQLTFRISSVRATKIWSSAHTTVSHSAAESMMFHTRTDWLRPIDSK